MSLELKKIINVDEQTLEKLSYWMYNWWGKYDGKSIDSIKCFMKSSLQEDRLPQTWGLFLDGKIIGMFQLTYEDLYCRPDIYPWLANVYIDENYRGKGYCTYLLENIKNIARNELNFDEIFLYTKYAGLYEKFGFEYVSDIDTYNDKSRVERLYKLNLKD